MNNNSGAVLSALTGILLALSLASCGDIAVPKFVGTDYIEIAKIQKISKFRSSEGHDYSDDFESCRSMKHYFMPGNDTDWSAVKVFSPVNGTVTRIYEEWAGTQVQISSDDYPAVSFIIFHVNLTNPLDVGDAVTAGQQIGTHIGPQTMSDIAVSVDTPLGRKLVSYFDVITDALFQGYQTRGLTSRADVIIPNHARDTDPLNCRGDSFSTGGTLENWVNLN